MIGFIAALLVSAGVVAMRSRATRRARAAIATRLTLQPDGIVRGAAAIDLIGEGSGAVLMLHGFGDTPQTLEYLAQAIHAQGWTVRAPLLPGHGRTLDDFSASRAETWIDFAGAELDSLRSRYATVSVIGLSMGGSLATILVAERPDIAALVLLAPYLSMPTRLRRAARFHHVLGVAFPYLPGGGGRSIRDPAEVARNLAYGFTTPRLVFELSRVVKQARAAAPKVSVPTLVVQSRQDHRIPPDAAERAFALFTAAERTLRWTEGNGHIITVDYGRDAIFATVANWLATHPARAGAAGAQTGRLAERPLSPS